MSAAPDAPRPEVVLCPGGPALVRSDVPAVDVVLADDEHVTERPVTALCRCGRTGRDPWCDGTHKLARPRTPSPSRKDDR